MLKRLFAAAAALGIACAASAADAQVAPEIPARAEFNWTGCYVGGFAGGAFVNTARSSDYVYTPYGTNTYSFDNGFIGGGTLGCNWQPLGAPWVLGLEGEAGYLTRIEGDLDGTTFAKSADNGNAYGLLTARVGYAIANTLFYVKGGAAYVDGSFTFAQPASTSVQAPTYVSTSGAKGHWTIGGGFELPILGNLILKAEYMFIDVKNDSPCVIVASNGSNAPGSYCTGVYVNGISTGKIGLNYLFNGWPAFPW
jgi:outer membrane immunogenic protein